MYNPSLRREPRYEPAAVIPLKQETNLLDWLAATGRLKSREPREKEEILDEEEEIAELIDVDDTYYDDDDDSFDDDEDLED